MIPPFLPDHINTGPWVAGYSLAALKKRAADARIVLPICSLGTAPEELARLADLVLPPLYHEALANDPDLKSALVAQIRRCVPFFAGTRAASDVAGRVEVVELPVRTPARAPDAARPRILAFGADTTVEQHGPHLPLGTDTIQTHAVLRRLASEIDGLEIGPALEHGHLTWGLPFGFSIDLTPPLLRRYAVGFINALVAWRVPRAIYVADVHGSVVHREVVAQALRESGASRARFRWLHDALQAFTAERGDMHAGGVETTLVQQIAPELVDATWWPSRVDELAAGQMSVVDAIAASADLLRFAVRVASEPRNGIIGEIRNAASLDGRELLERMVAVARADLAALA